MMIWPFKSAPEPTPEPVEPNCTHDNWRCTGSTTVGMATCIDCGKEIHLGDAFNRLRDRMVEAIERANRAT